MMGGASYPAVEVAVVSPQFCVSYPVDLIVTRKLMTLEDGTFGVTDVNGNLLFRIRGKVFSLHDRRVLLDAAGNPIITFQQKLLTAHRRWQAFRGESTDSKNMLFNVRKSSMIQFKTKLDVFMAANSKEDRCDFRIEGSWFERSCAIYAGDTNNVIAQMHKKHTAQSILLGKDTFCVTIYPNVDHAFIVALVVILEEINEDRSGDD
ncbi:protein LURP-one-related 15-like isoform X2 [Salvia miltiorrhiza]|uniref:protein LURP-one-related 15-like isoform X2 n=1 Tax=Salvia miltiorrhiza TaxID=226208 RepID=UPI0025AD6A14|nr:protein LURP-one-related 15-like isoform X2 [Salvia miltiorrhiza]